MKIIISLLVAASFLAATVAPTLATGDWYDTSKRADPLAPLAAGVQVAHVTISITGE